MSEKSSSPGIMSDSPSPSSGLASKSMNSNRRVVVVDQKMVKVPNDSIDQSQVGMRSPSALSCDLLTDHEAENADKQSIGSLLDVSASPESSRSSRSSIHGSAYSAMDTSSTVVEDRLLNELRIDIESAAVQLLKLQSEVEQVPILKRRIEELEKDKKVLNDDLSEKCEVIETMKQRLSVLHEQNSQLAQLTKNSPDKSSETLRMRNALVASLAQLKKFQEQEDELPNLKTKISMLVAENAKLKEQDQTLLERFSINLPEGATPLTYNDLLEENIKLKALNEQQSNDVSRTVKNIEVLSQSLEDLKNRVGDFEASLSSTVSASNHITKLEKEKEDLYQQIIQLKLKESISQDFNTVQLVNECETLRKANTLLRNRLESMTIRNRQQKQKMILKLFEIEISNLKSQKYEVERLVSDIGCTRSHASFTSCDSVPTSENTLAVLSPEFKSQLLKLHQFKQHSEESRSVSRMILSEKEELERTVADLNSKIEEKSIKELEHKVKEYDTKISIASAKITDLERRLHITSQAPEAHASVLVTENRALKVQVSSLREAQVHSATLQKQLAEEQQSHETVLQKYKKAKDQKSKLEKRLNESKDRFKSLASELSNSIQLLKDYQSRCEQLSKEVEELNTEKISLKGETNSLRAQLETMMAEYSPEIDKGESLEINSKEEKLSIGESKLIQYEQEIKKLSEENISLKQRLEEGESVQKVNEFKDIREKFQDISEQLTQAKETLLIQQHAHDSAALEASLMTERLQEEKDKISKDYEALSSSKAKLQHQVHQLEEENLKLTHDLQQAMDSYHEVQDMLDKQRELSNHDISSLKDSESRLLAEIKHYKSQTGELLVSLSTKEAELKNLMCDLEIKTSEIARLNITISNKCDLNKDKYRQLVDEVEVYKATIKNLQRHVDEAETRVIEHEHLRQKIKMLERSLGDSSHDNKALMKMLHEAVKEIPATPAEQSLQDRNLQLEEHISLLSQWNDKQRREIEELEGLLDESSRTNKKLSSEIEAHDECRQENLQLKRELQEVEVEVNALRRQVRADMEEELRVKLETQTQLLAVFNQHNTSLQKQVEDLQSQVKVLGGHLDREKAVSPPPMPNVELSLLSSNLQDHGSRSVSDLEKENLIYKQRIKIMEEEIERLHSISATIRRHSSSLHVISSVPIGAVNEEILVTVPPEMLLPCSLLADHLNINASLNEPAPQSWISAIQVEWFACMSQKALTPACAQCYIATISRLSHKLLDIVINLQDEKGNTALHYTASNGNLPALYQFIKLRSCDPSITNLAGYNALMLIAASSLDITNQKDVINTLVERTGINTVAKKDHQTILMLAAGSGNSGLVQFFLEKGCDINAKDKDGSTALMFAAQNGHEDIAQMLVSYSNCDILAKDGEGQTAKDIAKGCGYPGLSSIIKRTKH